MEIKLNFELSKLAMWLAWPVTGPYLLIREMMKHPDVMWFFVWLLSMIIGSIFGVLAGTAGYWVLLAFIVWFFGMACGYGIYRWSEEL